MKFKKLLIIIAIVCFLLALVVIKNSCQKSRSVKKSLEDSEVVLVNSSMNIFATKITIYNGGNEKDKVMLSRNSGGEWVLEGRFGLKAKKEIAGNLLNILHNLKGELRAESKSVFSDFQIQDNESAHLILAGADGKPLTHLVISFKTPKWNQNFIREFNSGKVVLVNRNILNAIGLFDKAAKCDGSFFTDYQVFSFDVNSVKGIELKDSRKSTLILVKSEPSKNEPESIWKFEPAKPKSSQPDPLKINEFLQGVASIRALDSLDPKLAIYGFDRPFMEATLKMLKDSQPSQIQILVGAYIKEKGAYYVQIMPQNQVLVISESFINNLNRDKTYFTIQRNKKNR